CIDLLPGVGRLPLGSEGSHGWKAREPSDCPLHILQPFGKRKPLQYDYSCWRNGISMRALLSVFLAISGPLFAADAEGLVGTWRRVWWEIVVEQSGPAVVHASDGSLVTTAKPARAGEILSLYASGLGPTFPGIDPGQPFTEDPLQVVSSPVDVTVGGAGAT